VTPALYALLVPALVTLMLAAAAYLRANTAANKIDELHVMVNSRLTQLLAVTGDAARAQGLAQGRAGNGNPNDPPRNISGIGS
jgi:hypothetical protein